jgi:hypothetical protein
MTKPYTGQEAADASQTIEESLLPRAYNSTLRLRVSLST